MSHLKDIALTANSIKGRSKKDIFEIVKHLLEGDDISHTEKAQLYKHFLPSIPKKSKEEWQWIAKALPKKKRCKVLSEYLYSDGVRLMATDGHRLHIIPTDLEAGYYDSALTKVNVEHKYPDVDRVIPSWGETWEANVKDLEIEHDENGFYYVGRAEKGIQKEYLDDALNGSTEFRYSYSAGGAYRIETDDDPDHTIVVMGRRY